MEDEPLVKSEAPSAPETQQEQLYSSQFWATAEEVEQNTQSNRGYTSTTDALAGGYLSLSRRVGARYQFDQEEKPEAVVPAPDNSPTKKSKR